MTAGRKINTTSQHWGTPEKYVDAVQQFFGKQVDLDPCSNEYSIVNAKVEYRLPKHDGLVSSWDYPTIYINPPYGIDKDRGTSIKLWLRKCAIANHEFGSEVLALIPVATNTGHWKNYIFGKATAVCFLYDTRLKFLVNGENGGKGAPMSCAMVYWGNYIEKFVAVFSPFGAVIDLRSLQGKVFGESKNRNQLSLLTDDWKNILDAQESYEQLTKVRSGMSA